MEIGYGSCSIVLLKKNYVIKRYKNDYESKEYLNKYNIPKREIEFLKILKNKKYIVQLIDYRINEDIKEIKLEYIEKGTLRNIILKTKIKNNEFSNDKIKIRWIKQIINGIYNIHNENIIHCDLNSNNILIDKNNNIKIIDFSSAKYSNEEFPIMDSIFWSSPEQLINDKSYFESDIYSLGLIIWEILNEKRPFEDFGDNYQEIEFMIKNNKTKDIHKINKNIFSEIIEKCLNYNYIERPNIKECVQFLQFHIEDVDV